MTRGRVDLKVVADRLGLARSCLADLRDLAAEDQATFSENRRNPAAAESFLRRAIEALFDTARHLLAKAYGIGGLEYREVARLCAERGLVTRSPLALRLLDIAGFRNRLAHYYHNVTAQEIFVVLQRDLTDLEAFADELEQTAARLSSEHEKETPDEKSEDQ